MSKHKCNNTTTNQLKALPQRQGRCDMGPTTFWRHTLTTKRFLLWLVMSHVKHFARPL